MLRSCARLAAFVVMGVTAFVAHSASAHNGAVVSKATFCAPPAPGLTSGDGGFEYRYEPSYVPAEADARYRFAWQDGDADPTGKFTFYYLDHLPPLSFDVNLIDGKDQARPGIGKIVKTVGGGEARDVYVSCACAGDDGGAGLCDGGSAPSCYDGGTRWCDNAVDWDTSLLPDGVYWIAAVNNDPPFHVYNMSAAPVRVAHGPHRPPVVLVVKPDGFSAFDGSMTVALIVAGSGALSLDLAWGIDEPSRVTEAVHGIAQHVLLTPDSHGNASYLWDTRALPPESYFVQATITDESGASSYSDSTQGGSVLHRSIVDAATSDAAGSMKAPRSGGCSCALGGAPGRAGAPASDGEAASLAPLCLIGLIGLVGLWAEARATRRARRGSRSACTGS